MRVNESHIAAMAKSVGITSEMFLKMVNREDRYKLESLKVAQLKDILKYLKSIGYYAIKLQLNKAEAIETIIEVLNGVSSDADSGSDININYADVLSNNYNNNDASLTYSSVVNTIRKREIYSELMNIPGITQKEVLVELQANSADLDPDTLLFNIINKRQVAEAANQANEAALQAQENFDVDRAIAESEHERDFIQSRKRARVQELKEDFTCLISSCEEFRPSILLSDQLNASGASRIGCSALRNLVNLVDSSFSSNQSSSNSSSSSSQSSVAIDSTIKSARQAVMNLLLLEMDAMKYHKKASIPYLCGLSVYLDQKLSSLELPSSTDSYISLLTVQTNRLQRALYKLPTDGQLVPQLFRKAFQDPQLSRVFKSSMDDDGFELLTESEVSSNSVQSGGVGGESEDLFKELYEVESEVEEDLLDSDEDDD